MATSKYLDENGLVYLWSRIKALFLTGVSTTTDSVNGVGTFTANTPTSVTKKTVVTSVSPATVVTSASGATATYSEGMMTFVNGSFSTGTAASVTTGDSVTVVEGQPATLTTTQKNFVTGATGTKTT